MTGFVESIRKGRDGHASSDGFFLHLAMLVHGILYTLGIDVEARGRLTGLGLAAVGDDVRGGGVMRDKGREDLCLFRNAWV